MKRLLTLALTFILLMSAFAVFDGAALAAGTTGADGHTHNWRDVGRTMQPTCTEYGYRTEDCTICGQVRQVPLSPLGHYFPNPWTTITAPTCTEAGIEMNTCVRVNRGKECGYEWWREIPVLGHDWDEGKVTKAPTATQDGEMTYTCKNDPSHTKTEVIPATGGEEKPALSITLWVEDWKTGEEKKEFKDGEEYLLLGSVTNTGNVDVEIYGCEKVFSVGNGVTILSSIMPSRYLLKPGETVTEWGGREFIREYGKASLDTITPGTETETLAGTLSFRATADAYKPGTYDLICSATASTSIGVLKDDGPHASLKYEITWDENAGEGKRYEGATVTAYCKTTNTGDCTVYPWPGLYSSFYHVSDAVFPSGTSWIEPIGKTAYTVDPGQSWTYTLNIPVRAKDVEQGFIDARRNDWADYENPKGYVVSADNCEIHIPLTYPDGGEPEEAKPELTLVWNRDEIYHPNKGWELTTAPGTLNPEDWIKPDFTVINSGNVNLRIDVCSVSAKYGGLSAHNPHGLLEAKDSMGVGSLLYPASEFITPGTETEDILGTVTETYWVVGKDPETYEELCESNKITRTWKIGKESGWEIPEDSNLEGRLEVRPGYESSDPAGYQLGEPVSTILYVKNTGLVDLDSFTVSDPWDGSTFTDGPIAVGEEKSYVRADTTVQPEDVEREYIDYPAIQITWIDPDSEKERPTVAGPLHLTVLSKTGLLLKKGVAFAPEEGDYFKEGEPIQWSLTVTNNSKDAVTDVTVEDKGKTVGSYAEIAPNDTKNCTVPVHIVTEYDVKVVGYVLNSATATGTDYRGAVHTWPSNVAKALTKKVDPDGDPKGDIDGLHPAITITKAEDPHGPLNGSYYEANEAIDYIITIRNVGDTELKDIAVTDSLAGFAPIGTLTSLAPGEEKTFTYSYTVKDSDLPFGWIYNSATVTYTFGEGVKGTPKTSDTVQSRVGDNPFPPETPHLDPEKLPNDEDYCSLILNTLGDTEARYTLHACAEHTEAAIAAEEAAQSGDWAAAAELWGAEVEALYETLYEAADSELKAALVAEKAAYDDYVDGLSALSHEAAAKELRVKSAFLCCALHTAPDELESSLAGDYAQSMGGEAETESARAFGPLTGSDSEVTETYAGRIAYAQKNVLGLMDIEKSYDWDKVFDRGVQLWQSALDSEVNPIYKAADKETRKQIALWRISLDTLSAAEKPFLTLLYEGNNNAITETLMNLYKDAAFVTSYLK